MAFMIKGYKLNSTDFVDIEKALNDLQGSIQKHGQDVYNKLFAATIEQVVDDIALNVIPRPNQSIYDAARAELEQKIGYASANGLPDEYNFSAQIAIYLHEQATYFNVIVENKTIERKCGIPQGLQAFDCTEDDAYGTEKTWAAISEAYKDTTTLRRQFHALQTTAPDYKPVSKHFQTRAQRIKTRIRWQQTSVCMNMLGMGKEIPPHKLMSCFDEAIMLLSAPQMKRDAQNMEVQLAQTMVNITEDMVRRDTNQQPEQAD